METVNLSERQLTVFRARLRQFYRKLDSTTLSFEICKETRSDFFRKAQGEFIHVLRLKKNLPDCEVANFINVDLDKLLSIEHGEEKISDRDFFRVCTYLGGANEVSVFFEKLECAMQPGLREARNAARDTLKMYGIRFADDDHR